MNRWSDLIGETCIYNIMGSTAAPRPTGGDAEAGEGGGGGEFGDDDPLLAAELHPGRRGIGMFTKGAWRRPAEGEHLADRCEPARAEQLACPPACLAQPVLA